MLISAVLIISILFLSVWHYLHKRAVHQHFLQQVVGSLYTLIGDQPCRTTGDRIEAAPGALPEAYHHLLQTITELLTLAYPPESFIDTQCAGCLLDEAGEVTHYITIVTVIVRGGGIIDTVLYQRTCLLTSHQRYVDTHLSLLLTFGRSR